MANEDEVKILGFWASPYVMRVLIALEEKGIKYEYVEEDLRSKSPLLLEMNPVYKKVPVLVHNDRPVAESLVALQYIDEVWTEGLAILPADPYDRAIARFWADFVDKKIYDNGRIIFRTKEEEQKVGMHGYIENLRILEEMLKGKNYFGGDKFGLVDIVFAPQICWFHTYEILGGFKIPFEEKFPSIAAWIKKCKTRESVKKIFPQAEKVLQMATQARKHALGEA